MDIALYIARITAELQAIFAAEDHKAAFLGRLKDYYDNFTKQRDFPGPDAITVPFVWMNLSAALSVTWDLIASVTRHTGAPSMAWMPELPEAPETEEGTP